VSEKIRIEEVARVAGVSPTTVSRVINKIPTVTEENRIKVESAIRKLNFKPNILAQRLAKGRADNIALVIPRYEGIFFSFYANQIIRGVGVACESLKLDLLLHLSSERNFIDVNSVGGVLFADVISNNEELKNVLSSDVPCIVMNHRFNKDANVDFIAIDNKKGAKEAVDYLIHLGHKNIAHITGNMITQSAQERIEGYKLALQENNIPVKEGLIIKGDYSRPSARRAMVTLLKIKPLPTAIFVGCDDMAQEVTSVLLENGLKVPDDVSIVGFDDNPICLAGSVALTTVRQPLVEMAAKAASLLNKMILSKTAKTSTKTILATDLIIRDSCRQI
jgi:DNA-binding LacI/PurR family transcriptional regulator